MDLEALQGLSREQLTVQARAVGVGNPEAMTRPELIDEIVRRTEVDAGRRRVARGWFGVARDLLAGMVEQGLNLPDAAALIRGDANFAARIRQPVATVTLAEIYAAQGHLGRALRMLDEVLALEPDHRVARALRERIVTEKTARGLPTDPPPGVELPVIPMSPPPSEPSAAAGEPGELEESPATDRHPSETASLLGADRHPSELEELPATDRHPSEPMAASASELPGASAVDRELRAEEAEPAAPAPSRESAAFWALRGGSFCVYWELSDRRRAALASRSGGHLVVALLLVSPGAGGARSGRRELPVHLPAGLARLPVPRLDVVGRAALGWRRGNEFTPLVVAEPLAASAVQPGAATARHRALAALGDDA